MNDTHPLLALTLELEGILISFNDWCESHSVAPRESRAFAQLIEQAQVLLDWVRLNEERVGL